MFSRPVLIFSNYCNHSKNFLNMLMETELSQELAKQFVYVNVDVDPNTKKRGDDFLALKSILAEKFNYNLNSVPTIIVENGEFILKDSDAFEWLKHTLDTFLNTQMNKDPGLSRSEQGHEEQVESDDISGFNPNEMGAFSDMYSTFGLNVKDPCMDAKNQCFQFLDKNFTINTPDGEKVQGRTGQHPGSEQPVQMIKSVRFNNDSRTEQGGIKRNMGNMQKSKKGYGTEKEKELNSKYEQLMIERQSMDKKLIPPDRIG
jgi:hypothetical protein